MTKKTAKRASQITLFVPTNDQFNELCSMICGDLDDIQGDVDSLRDRAFSYGMDMNGVLR